MSDFDARNPPSGNPSGRTVLIVLGTIVVIVVLWHLF
jgi:hypothetical protein